MPLSLPEFLADEQSLGVFLLVSVAIGGGGAWLGGRAVAATWRPWWHIALYMLLLALAVRFLHYALFDSTFLSPADYTVDYVVCLAFGFIGFRLMRVSQMVTRYSWINQRSGVWRWRRRDETPVHNP